jgi:hypothetical protein
VQGFGGAPEVQLLGDGDEPADLDQIELCDAAIVSPANTSVLAIRRVSDHRVTA